MISCNPTTVQSWIRPWTKPECCSCEGGSSPYPMAMFRRFSATGDSITDSISVSDYDTGVATAASALNARGYLTWLRILFDSKYDYSANQIDRRITFAKSGHRTDQIIADYLDAAVACTSEVHYDQSGINDIFQGYSDAHIVTNRIAIWEALQTAGKTVAAGAITPVGITYPGNEASFYSNRVNTVNVLLADAAADRDIPFITWENLSVSPGVMNPDYSNDNVHPNDIGGKIMAQAIYEVLSPIWIPLIDLDRPSYDYYSSNPQLDGLSIPDQWAVYPPGTGTVASNLIIPVGDGTNIWEVEIYDTDISALFDISNYNGNVADPAYKILEAYAEIEVVSGSVSYMLVTASNYSIQNARIPLMEAAVEGYITPVDGKLIIRSQPFQAGNDANFAISIYIATNEITKVQIHKPCIRSYQVEVGNVLDEDKDLLQDESGEPILNE